MEMKIEAPKLINPFCKKGEKFKETAINRGNVTDLILNIWAGP
jgi:hypothetical protein